MFIYILAPLLTIAALGMTNISINTAYTFAAAFAILLFASPTYFKMFQERGWKRAAIILGGIGLFALAVETLAIKTGLPYGNFSYGEGLGGKIADTTPWTVAFAFPPLLLLGYWFGNRFSTIFWKIIAITVAITVYTDIVLDPAAVSMGMWAWDTPGFYYGVPLINYFGWIITATLGGLLLHKLWGNAPVKTSLTYSGLAVVWFWAWVNIGLQQWIPGLLGVIGCVIFAIIINKSTKNIDKENVEQE